MDIRSGLIIIASAFGYGKLKNVIPIGFLNRFIPAKYVDVSFGIILIVIGMFLKIIPENIRNYITLAGIGITATSIKDVI